MSCAVSLKLDSFVNLLDLHLAAEGGLTVDLVVADVTAGPQQSWSDTLTKAAFSVVH